MRRDFVSAGRNQRGDSRSSGGARPDHGPCSASPAWHTFGAWPCIIGCTLVCSLFPVGEIEVKEKKDRVDDALNAARAAVTEGIVPGGGIALLRAKKAVGKLTNDNSGRSRPVSTSRFMALEAPILLYLPKIAGVSARSLSAKVSSSMSETFGFDAQNDEYVVTMVGKGILDPGQGRAHRAAGRRLDRWPAGHHRSHGRRTAEGRGSRHKPGGGGGMGGMGGGWASKSLASRT